MAQGSPDRRIWTADEMLEAFCALGGAVKNIRPGEGGDGLFVIDATEPVLLRVPRNLLFRIEDVEFSGGRIAIQEGADVPDAEREFFAKYQASFAWGGAGRARSAAFIDALDELPGAIREFLSAEFGLADLLQGDAAERIQNHFLRAHEIPWRGGAVIAPLLEFAGRSSEGLRHERGLHLQIQGYARDPIKVRYEAEDPWSAFRRFGVAESQTLAFSLVTRMRSPGGEIVINRNTSESVKRGEHRVSRTEVDGETVSLSYLIIGHRKSPRVPRGTFCSLAGEAGVTNPDEAFDSILRYNTLRFVRLLQALEGHEGEMISTLRKTARHQLEAINFCIGSRPLPPATAPGISV